MFFINTARKQMNKISGTGIPEMWACVTEIKPEMLKFHGQWTCFRTLVLGRAHIWVHTVVINVLFGQLSVYLPLGFLSWGFHNIGGLGVGRVGRGGGNYLLKNSLQLVFVAILIRNLDNNWAWAKNVLKSLSTLPGNNLLIHFVLNLSVCLSPLML